jgi:hypothetical protein
MGAIEAPLVESVSEQSVDRFEGHAREASQLFYDETLEISLFTPAREQVEEG